MAKYSEKKPTVPWVKPQETEVKQKVEPKKEPVPTSQGVIVDEIKQV